MDPETNVAEVKRKGASKSIPRPIIESGNKWPVAIPRSVLDAARKVSGGSNSSASVSIALPLGIHGRGLGDSLSRFRMQRQRDTESEKKDGGRKRERGGTEREK